MFIILFACLTLLLKDNGREKYKFTKNDLDCICEIITKDEGHGSYAEMLRYDLNEDGIVDIFDLINIRNKIIGYEK